jgi:hypothetical protein
MAGRALRTRSRAGTAAADAEPDGTGADHGLGRALDRLNAATTAGAAARLKAGDAAGLGGALVLGPLGVLRAYFKGGGWRGGGAGLLYCLLTGYTDFILHLKIWEQRRKGP